MLSKHKTPWKNVYRDFIAPPVMIYKSYMHSLWTSSQPSQSTPWVTTVKWRIFHMLLKQPNAVNSRSRMAHRCYFAELSDMMTKISNQNSGTSKPCCYYNKFHEAHCDLPIIIVLKGFAMYARDVLRRIVNFVFIISCNRNIFVNHVMRFLANLSSSQDHVFRMPTVPTLALISLVLDLDLASKQIFWNKITSARILLPMPLDSCCSVSSVSKRHTETVPKTHHNLKFTKL